jgi:hypothetical protein
VSIADTSQAVPTPMRSDIGSSTTTGGIKIADQLLHRCKKGFEAEQGGANASELQQALLQRNLVMTRT